MEKKGAGTVENTNCGLGLGNSKLNGMKLNLQGLDKMGKSTKA